MPVTAFKRKKFCDPGPNPALLAQLRAQVQSLEHSGEWASRRQKTPMLAAQVPEIHGPETISAGATAVDSALPWDGLPTRGLHEIFGDTAALGFTASLLARLLKHKDTLILWCRQAQDPYGQIYGQGLATAGLDPERLILVDGRNDTEILWVMEEGLRTSTLAAVIGMPRKIPPIAGRRLQLAAEESGTTGFLLRPEDDQARSRQPGRQAATSAALSRWRVLSVPSRAGQTSAINHSAWGRPQWRLELQRCRFTMAGGQNLREAGKPRAWLVEWCHETGNFPLVSALRNRPATATGQKVEAA